jgi:hypothetical protein
VVSGNIPPTKYEAQGEVSVQLPDEKAYQQVFPLPAKMDLAVQEPDQGG